MDGGSQSCTGERADVRESKSSQGDVGFRVRCPDVVLQHTRVRMLTAEVLGRRKTWFVPAQRPLDLLFFRAIFSELQRRQGDVPAFPSEATDADISIEAFQNAMERLFYVLGETEPFDARVYDDGDYSVTWSEFFRVYRERELVIKLSPLQRIYLTMDAADSCHMAQLISNCVLLTIILSSTSFVFGTLHDCKMGLLEWCGPFKAVELSCLLLFSIEYCLRLCTCWTMRPELTDEAKLLETVVGFEAISDNRPLKRLFQFVMAPSNLVDLAAILPGVVSKLSDKEGGAFVVLRLIRLTRILRAFKSPSLSEAVKVITMTMHQSTQALYILCFNLMLGIVIFGSLMYMAEGGPELNAFGLGGKWNPEEKVFERVIGWTWNETRGNWDEIWAKSHFQSIPHACWWAMVTVATVGYGDQTPTTLLGKIVGVGTMLFSLVILALPVGVIGGTFSNVWEECELMKKAQEHQLKLDLKFVAHELSRLDPIVMSKLMLIEVWNDQGFHIEENSRPPPAAFMGEAKVQLDITPHEPCSIVVTVPLSANRDIANRRVTGKVTLQYRWTPDSCDTTDVHVATSVEENVSGSRSTKRRLSTSSRNQIGGRGQVQALVCSNSMRTHLEGTLEVTLLSAENLINLNTHQRGASSPYCMIFCYPGRSKQANLPEPVIWRTPTAKQTLHPFWGISHIFEFSWRPLPLEVERSRSRDHRTMSCGGSRTPSPSPHGDGTGSDSNHPPSQLQPTHRKVRSERSNYDDGRVDELVCVAEQLNAQLMQHKAELRKVRRAVRSATRRAEDAECRLEQRGLRSPSPREQRVPQLQQFYHRQQHEQHDQQQHRRSDGAFDETTDTLRQLELDEDEEDVDCLNTGRLAKLLLTNDVTDVTHATLVKLAGTTQEPWSPSIEV
mmetsp:Transcript_77112/g.223120  ORF Transcript_77112/g.223120 Transcript_77112/m.223120 type:complete len:897 (-) Transcript_77112:123-2813(-)